MRDSSSVVKNLNTPLMGGWSASGFVASMTGFPVRFATPAARSAFAATLPLTARTTNSPNWAASAKLPMRVCSKNTACLSQCSNAALLGETQRKARSRLRKALD